MLKLQSLRILRSIGANLAKNRYYSSTSGANISNIRYYRHKDYDSLNYSIINGNSIALISNLCNMVLNKEIDSNKLFEMKEYRDECEIICDQTHLIVDHKLIALLYSLLLVEMDNNSRLIRCLENELLWRASKLSFKQLLKCLNYHVRYQQTDQQKKVVNEMIFQIQSHLDNASDVDDIIHLFRLAKYFTVGCISLIEETALQIIVFKSGVNFTAQSLCYLLVLLSQLKRRPKPLIRAIVYKLTELSMEEGMSDNQSEKLSHLISTVRALKSLNYPDNDLLDKICNILCNRNFIDTVSPAYRKDLLTTIGLMNYCHSRVMACFIEKIINNPTFFSEQELATFVAIAARLNYQPNYMQEIIPTFITPYVKPSTIDSYAWLTYVWSLAILESASSFHISSVLNDEFCNKLLTDKNSYEQTISKLKLLNIKAVAEIEMGLEVNAPKCLITNLEMPKRQNEVELLRTSILDSLNSFIPKNLYMATNVITPFGFTIDAEFIINSSLDPLKLSDYGNLGSKPNDDNIKEVPIEYKRVAVLSIGFNDTLLDSNQLIGTNELVVRILKKLNYSVLIVNQNHFSSNISYVKRISNLQLMISNLFQANF